MDDLYSVVRILINNQNAIFNGGNAHVMEVCDRAFTMLEANKEVLEDEDITEDLDEFIEYGICAISSNFENGKPIGPNVMNVLIRAVRLYNNASSRPFQLNRECHLTTLEGMLFLSNTVLDIVHSPDLQFFPQDYPPWQLHIKPRPRPRPRLASTVEEPLTEPPRIVVIHTHGIMPVKTGDEENPNLPRFKFPFNGRALGNSIQPISVSSRDHRKNEVVDFETEVDTFTTAQFGKPLRWFMAEHPPQLVFAENLEMIAADEVGHTKSAFRQMIERALCKMREHIPDTSRSTCEIRCHRAGNRMTDIFLFGKGAATVEGIVSINTQTGTIDDVSHQFGLVSKETLGHTLREYPKSSPPTAYRMDAFADAKAHAESELAAAAAAAASGTVPETYHMHALKKHIKNLDMGIRNMNRESEFVWTPEMKQKHGDEIRLSVLMQNGINAGLIKPKRNDFVVVLSCRIPEKQLPIGAKSPRNRNESDSEGGGRKSKKHKRFNQSKKRKQRTTSRKSRKSRKH